MLQKFVLCLGAAFVVVLAALLTAIRCPAAEWPQFRSDDSRSGESVDKTLSDPKMVSMLGIRWTFPTNGAVGAFRGSPVVFNGRVYIGSSDGDLYAIDAVRGTQLWKFPGTGGTPLKRSKPSTMCVNPSSEGIAASPVVTTINGETAVIIGAPDPASNQGDGYLWAVRASDGSLIWKSSKVARFTGFTKDAVPPSEYHEQIGFSSPLVVGSDIYVGISDNCDDPIQKGRLVAVKLSDGTIDTNFQFCSVGTCADFQIGGDIWSSPAYYNGKLFVTTGNSRTNTTTPPSPDHALSILGLDLAGNVVNEIQPVSWALDNDPDFAATPSVVNASCGTQVIATQKDGFTHALNPNASGATQCAWSYPPPPDGNCIFRVGDGTVHSDDDYKRSGAAWGDVYVTMNGGANLITDYSSGSGGLWRLHAFNVCPTAALPLVRWIVDVPNATHSLPGEKGYILGHPTIAGGIVYVGTDQGHLVAIADTNVQPTGTSQCSNPDFTSSANCLANGYKWVPTPAVIANVAMPDGGGIVYTEPVLAEGMVSSRLGTDMSTCCRLRMCAVARPCCPPP